MSPIITAKKRVTEGSVKEAFRNEAGAIDLASIMVGIIVIGLIGGVIAATVFAVIPWAQDNAAKQQLDSVAAAQSAYIGLSSNNAAQTFGGAPITISGTGTTSFTWTASAPDATARLSVGGAAPVTERLFSAPSGTKISIASYGENAEAHYVAAVRSASGVRFYITDAKTQATSAGTGTGSPLGTQTTPSGASITQIATAQNNAAINAVVTSLPN